MAVGIISGKNNDVPALFDFSTTKARTDWWERLLKDYTRDALSFWDWDGNVFGGVITTVFPLGLVAIGIVAIIAATTAAFPVSSVGLAAGMWAVGGGQIASVMLPVLAAYLATPFILLAAALDIAAHAMFELTSNAYHNMQQLVYKLAQFMFTAITDYVTACGESCDTILGELREVVAKLYEFDPFGFASNNGAAVSPKAEACKLAPAQEAPANPVVAMLLVDGQRVNGGQSLTRDITDAIADGVRTVARNVGDSLSGLFGSCVRGGASAEQPNTEAPPPQP